SATAQVKLGPPSCYSLGLSVIQAATRTFPALLDAVAAAFGPRTFLQRRSGRGGDPVTYEALFAEVRVVAAGLLARGIGRGDRIGLISENRCEWLVADLAAISIGAADVPRGSDTSPPELALILAHSGARFVFADHDKT